MLNYLNPLFSILSNIVISQSLLWWEFALDWKVSDSIMVSCRQGRHTLSRILIINYCHQGNTEKWRIMVTSSLTEISKENRVGGGGGRGVTPPTPPRHSRLLDKYLQTTLTCFPRPQIFIFASRLLHLICSLHKCTICTYRRNLFTLGGT